MSRCARCFADISDLTVFCPQCSQLHEPDFDRLLERTIAGRYRLYRRLGQGGSSSVFAATDLQTDRVVVVKVSDPSQLARRDRSHAIEPSEARSYWAEMLERMKREVEILAGMDHPNIVRVIDSGALDEDLRFVVLELLRGRTLREEIDRREGIDLNESLRIGQEIAGALVEVHAHDIIHRDINPRNIFLEESPEPNRPRVKLIDFGIAKYPLPEGSPPLTQFSVLSGTVAYASPEQCQSAPLDHRTDIYSLGIVLYEMTTGQKPFTGRTPTEVALKQIQSIPVSPRMINPEISIELEQVILRALAKDPAQRPQTAREMADELRSAGRHTPLPLPAKGPDDETRWHAPLDRLAETGEAIDNDLRLKVARRRRRLLATTAALLIVPAAIAGILAGREWFGSRTPVSSSLPAKHVPTPERNPILPGSDADSLELAAKLSQEQEQPMVTAPIRPAATLPASQPTKAERPAISSKPVGKVPATTEHREKKREAASKPSPKPAPARTVARRTEPKVAPKPVRKAPPPAEMAVAKPEKPVEIKPASLPQPERLPAPGNQRREDNPPPPPVVTEEESPVEPIGPKLIQWNGRVNGQREIRLEMPGVPGRIDIPRVYRDRVGIVEPPSEVNQWRSAVLRVFGKGGVMIVVRWWPFGRVD